MTPEIPERFKGVKFTKAGKPDTRSKLGKEFQAYLDKQSGGITHGNEVREALRKEAQVFAEQLDSLTNPENFASEGQDAPDPHPHPTTTESLSVDEKTALVRREAELEPSLGQIHAPKLGTHDAARALIEHIVQAYPNAKRGDWAKVQFTLQAAMKHVRVWMQAHPPGQ